MQVPPNCDLTLGLTCLDKSEPGRTTWEMTADERFANPAGIVQGGFVGALCDSAMGASAVTFANRASKANKANKASKASKEPRGGFFCANAEMKTSFLRPVEVGSRLTCTAAVVSGGDRIVFCEAEVVDQAGRLVARASSTYVLSPREPA